MEDLADAALGWLENGDGLRGTYELHDGRPGGYSWHDVIATADDGLVYKVAAGPAIQLEASPWVRPVIRLSAAIIGGDKVITGFEDENEIRLGAQFETWF